VGGHGNSDPEIPTAADLAIRQLQLLTFALQTFDMRPIISALQKTAAAWTPSMRTVRSPRISWKLDSICTKCRVQQFRQISQSRQLADGLNVVDHPARIVRVNKKHGPGLIILGMYNFCPRKQSLMHLSSNSSDSHYRIHPGIMAGTAVGLENQTDC
jgi:hypothetical protein